MVGIFGKDFFLQFFAVEDMCSAELYPVLYQSAIGLEHFRPEIHVHEKHGNEEANDEKHKNFEHELLCFSAKIQFDPDWLVYVIFANDWPDRTTLTVGLLHQKS